MANTISLAISESIVEYIDTRVASGGYGNRSEYIRDLVRLDQREQARQRLRLLIEEGMRSGAPTPMTGADWADMDAALSGKVSA